MEIPKFYVEKLLNQYEPNIVNDIINGLNSKRKVTFRVNTLISTKEEIEEILKKENIKFKQVSWYKDAFIIEDKTENDLKNLEIYESGKIYLQSLSSMIPTIILDPKENENILDMCASPGGKTIQMACLSNNKSYITACERNRIRGEKLKYNLQKQKSNRVNVMLEDARNLNDLFKFDKILLDAPCSGSGTENVFKKNFTEELINKSRKIQEELLKKALKILKPGGTIVYSTCSILKEENEAILEKIKKEINIESIEISKEIKLLPSKLNDVAVVAPNELYEGFFIAKVIKK